MPARASQKRGWRWGVVLALSLAALASAPAQAAEQTRYSVVNGCFALAAPGGGYVAKGAGSYAPSANGVGAAAAFRLQATDLATYLLYDTDREFLGVRGNEIVAVKEPSPRTEWKLREAPGGTFTLTNLGAAATLARSGDALALGKAGHFELVPAKGCVDYPEISVSASGKPKPAKTKFGETRGYWDPHMHIMAFEAFGGGLHCGRPWHRYGVPYALPDCSKTEGPNGSLSPIENFLNWESPVAPHDTQGWPHFRDWPNHKSITYEQTYYKWLERTWRGGMRLVTNLFVDNRAFCEILAQPQHRRNPCNEMETVRREAKSIYEMQDYIDAQFGGPGKGFFRIVKTPFEARKVISQGKMAVVLGIEVSELFGCTLRAGQPQCDQDDVDAALDEVYKLGVRQMELLNKFDNAFVGVRFDSGLFGAIVNLGNFYTTGRFWQVAKCKGEETDNTIPLVSLDLFYDLGLAGLLPPGGLPVYPSAPHCNVLGMTPLGEYLVAKMIDKGMIIDPDHMSVDAANRTLQIAKANGYSGVVSSHSWTDKRNWPDIYEVGGVVGPMARDSKGFYETWKETRKMRDPDYYFGFGFGDDMNGFASQGGPRNGPNPVKYPFKSFDGAVKIKRQQSGTRTFDFNVDGVAHYGLYPDWVEDLRQQGGRKIVRDLSRGAEAYLQMWERAVGVPPERCRPAKAKLTASGLGRLRLGDSAVKALKRAGQPARRIGREYRYCVAGKANRKAQVVAKFTRGGKLTRITTNAKGYEAGGVAVGDPASAVRRADQPRGARFVYRVAGGKVRSVGVARR